jgi:hypothetical protein
VKLVLGEGLSGEQVHGARSGVAEDEVEDWEVIAERLAAGRRGDDYDVAAGGDLIEGVGLVDVEAGNAALFEGRAEADVDCCGDVGEDALGGGLVVDGADGGVGFLVQGLEAGDDGIERRVGGGSKLLGEFGESEGEVNLGFAFSLLRYNGGLGRCKFQAKDKGD